MNLHITNKLLEKYRLEA